MMAKKIEVLVTAGPTREYLDPVRFLSNASSGLMGYLTADAARKDNVNVTLISGPTNISPPSNVKTVFVQSANEMYKQVMKCFSKTDIFISSAAVSDYRPVNISKSKLKKGNKPVTLKLLPNRDILHELGTKLSLNRQNSSPKVLVGFALETDNLVKNAITKMRHKNLDLIVANIVKCIGTQTIEGFIINRRGEIQKIKKTDKRKFAQTLWKLTKATYVKKANSKRIKSHSKSS